MADLEFDIGIGELGTEECPIHRWRQRIIKNSVTPGSDPCNVEHLECGHQIIFMGPYAQATVLNP